MIGRQIRIIALSILFIILSSLHTGECREICNVYFPESITINDKSCILNGIAVRKILGFDIYIGALYLEKKTQSEREAISSEQIKHVKMHFLFKEINEDLIAASCMKGFKKNSGTKYTSLTDKIEHFLYFFTHPLKKGDSLHFTYIPEEGTEVTLQGEEKGIIKGHDFMELIASNWLGPFPPSKRFKQELLGH